MSIYSAQSSSSSSSYSASSTDVTFGEKEFKPGWGTSFTSYINSRTVMDGASKDWDPKRLERRMRKLEKIGGKHLFLISRTGDKISAFHFTAADFHKALTNMGGKPVSLEVQFNHPFFERAEPVHLTQVGRSNTDPGIRIPYDAEFESEFKNPSDFLEYCHERSFVAVWEDTLEPFSVASWWHWNSRKQNLVLIPKIVANRLKIQENPSTIKIDKATEVDPYFSVFDKEPKTSQAYVFDGDPTAVRRLFSTHFQDEKGLKIESSFWTLALYKGNVYFVENQEVASQLEYIDHKKLERLPSVQVLTIPIQPKTEGNRATVVLSMNQTNSFVSYSHEILTFLLMGVDVVVYDNGGKGLSTGLNSHEGMVEAVDVVGRYLIEKKGINKKKVIFKGQCAGGFATSKVMQRFGTHGWIDQAPQTFSGRAADLVEKKVKATADLKGGWLSTLARILPYTKYAITMTASMVLPSYDVVDSFSKTDPNAIKIYTIGVPDERGYGGDEMVSIEERDAIKDALEHDPNGHYLTINGGTHVTDWWTDPHVLKRVTDIFAKHSLSVSIFPDAPKTAEEAVERSYEAYFQKPYNPKTASADEKSVYRVFQAVKDQNFGEIEFIIHRSDSTVYMPAGLIDRLSTKEHSRLLHLAISLSKALGNQLFTSKLMLAQKRNTI